MNINQLTREGSQLWNPTSQELTAAAAGLSTGARHSNNFPPSRHCTEQFTGPAGPNPNAGPEDEQGMIDFTAPNVRQQIADSERFEMVGQTRGQFPDEEEAPKKPTGPQVIHNPYSINQVYLKIDPDTLAYEHREQSDYFTQVAANLRQRNRERAPQIVALNPAGVVFMPPRPPSIESFDVFVKGGCDDGTADTLMTNIIYRWYSLCNTNLVTYRNWYTAVHGSMDGSNPPNPNDFVDLAEWCFAAERWHEALFATHQALRHHSRSAAIAAGSAAPHMPSQQRAGPSGSPSSGAPAGGAAVGGISPSKRATAVPPPNSNIANGGSSYPSHNTGLPPNGNSNGSGGPGYK